VGVCAISSIVIAGLCSLVSVNYGLKHVDGLIDRAGRRMSEDAMEFVILAVMVLLPLTAAGLILAVFAGPLRKAALVAQTVSVGLGIGLLVFYEVSR
jgi:hypothetical protein